MTKLISRYHAITGQTAIEFWMRKGQDKLIKDNCYDPDSRIVDFRQKDRMSNLEVVFGTRSLWKVFMPSWRKLPTDGVDWENWINHENEHNKILLKMRRT